VFDPSDHRQYNRRGESFDVGETFAGLDYDTGLAVVEELRSLVPAGATLAQVALRWILMSDAVTAAIPGAKTPEQARANAAAADLAAISPATMDKIGRLYEDRVKPIVHQRW
jgi:aryl-alcohol dehydrogenase-like predicted oxidoreductase